MQKTTTQRRIVLAGEEIDYCFTRKHIKNINIRMRPETGLGVSAPHGVPLEQVEAVLRQNQQRILDTLHKYAAQRQARQQQYPLTYTDGETVLYLGRTYTLQVAQSQTEGVRVEGEHLLLLTRYPGDGEQRRRIFDRWWNETCAKMVCNLCRAVYPIFQPHQIPFPTIRFRAMVSQWGNCRPERGVLTFNTRLLAASPRCMEYVVIHEFTHFLYPNHSAAFYQFIAQEIPDWRALQEILQNQVETRLPSP